jgi:hypothetical protein
MPLPLKVLVTIVGIVLVIVGFFLVIRDAITRSSSSSTGAISILGVKLELSQNVAIIVIGVMIIGGSWLVEGLLDRKGTEEVRTDRSATTTTTTPNTSQENTTDATTTTLAQAVTTVPPTTSPTSTGTLSPGLFCKDLASAGWGAYHALAYWVREGMPDRMDTDHNGIPCETVYSRTDIDSALYSDGGQLNSGLLCEDLLAAGYAFSDALMYWIREGAPNRMDADSNGIPCETVYPGDEIEPMLMFELATAQ